MKHLINLIEYLEGNHHYAQVDELVRVALDMSDVLTEDNKLGSGVAGSFYSDFDQNEQGQLKDKLGTLPEGVGFKQYHALEAGDIAEVLAFIYIAPYISANTDLKTPVYRGEISLSGIISNQIMPTQKMNGVSIYYLEDKLSRQRFEMVCEDVDNRLLTKLNKINVEWVDAHDENYLLDKRRCDQFITSWKQADDSGIWMEDFIQTFDITTGISLFDFGSMSVGIDTPPGQALLRFGDKIYNLQNNLLSAQIKDAIGLVLHQ